MEDITRLFVDAACTKLAMTASLHMDQGRFVEFANLFVEDGEFVRPSTFPDDPLKGREEIASVLAERFAGFTSRHLCTNVIVNASGADEATASSFFLHISDRGPGSASPSDLSASLRSMGEYYDEFVRSSEGWRIKRRVGRFRFRNA